MAGLLIVTHSDFARGLLNAAESILGSVSRAEIICISRQDSPDEIKGQIAASLERLRAYQGGAIILTDMFGGTPSNLSMAFLDSGLIEVVAGVNLPMVLKFFNNRDSMAVGDLASLLRDYGQQSIRLASDFLKK
jgi:PTS system mannose-specific IIA component